MKKLLIPLLLIAALPAQTPPIRVTLLGTAGPSMTTDRAEAGTLVEAGSEVLLFDCGRLVPERLTQIGMAGVTKVFLTHLHSDHTDGLPILWMGAWRQRGTTPISLFGPATIPQFPAGTKALAEHITSAFDTDTRIRRDLVERLSADAIKINAKEIAEGVVYQDNGVTVTAFLVDHSPVEPAFGYRIDYGGYAVVISGDTRPSDNLVKFAKGADVLIHEVFQGAAGLVADYHTSPVGAAGIFNRVAPKLAVYTHVIGGNPTAATRAAGYTGPLVVGTDLTTISIGPAITYRLCESPSTPTVTAVTSSDYKTTLASSGVITVWGSGFSPGGGNSVRFARAAAMPGGSPGTGNPPAVVIDDAAGSLFWDFSANQINAPIQGRVSAGAWILSVQNACGVTSAGLAITLQ